MTFTHTTSSEDTTISNIRDLSGILDEAIEIIARLDKRIDEMSEAMDSVQALINDSAIDQDTRTQITKLLDAEH